ncbi:hypothetical protein AN619_26660 [Thermotalea metallivorans]|uniref:Uncharacterized protein n=2 Tax=Thermotalea metallivorans TaxID=520762 RepID=A0A140L0I1_9FIRM|nr:hypothetical protein AN619_26660 [Thermotalea metallivorans]
MLMMLSNMENQYIHYHISGTVYHFYKMADMLFVKTMKDNKIQGNSKIGEDIIDFAVDVDNEGIFHLVSISANGELTYWKGKALPWDRRILTKYDIASYQFKNLKIFIWDHKIHILIAVANRMNPDLWTLKHHYWNHSIWYNKKVCNIVAGKYDMPFHADMDMHHHIHILYKSIQNHKAQIFYSKFNTTYNAWSTPQQISNLLHENSHPFVFCDHLNHIHAVWASLENNNFEIYYRVSKSSPFSKTGWSEAIKLSIENTNCTHPFIMEIENTLKLIWKQNNKYYAVSNDFSGSLWSTPFEISVDPALKISPVAVIGSTYKSYHPVKIPMGHMYMHQNEFYILGLDPIVHIEDHRENKRNDQRDIPQDDPWLWGNTEVNYCSFDTKTNTENQDLSKSYKDMYSTEPKDLSRAPADNRKEDANKDISRTAKQDLKTQFQAFEEILKNIASSLENTSHVLYAIEAKLNENIQRVLDLNQQIIELKEDFHKIHRNGAGKFFNFLK